MNALTSKKAEKLILLEYPFLEKSSLSIKKQYRSANGRVYNTFLVESSKEGFEKFVAKAVFAKQNGLELEWTVLKFLQREKGGVPKLLIPEHKPERVMLLEYIGGQNASDTVVDDTSSSKVFELVGSAVGKLHSTKISNFGDLLNPRKTYWSEYIKKQIRERLSGTKALIPDFLYIKAEELVNSLDKTIELESKGKPVLVHRDIYFDNFIIGEDFNQAFLIDYGMAIGGRPFYDLGKFYILELYKRPNQKNNFLEAYSKHVSLPSDFNKIMKLYILNEALGMINFFYKINDNNAKKHAVQVLKELTEDKGVIAQLLS